MKKSNPSAQLSDKQKKYYKQLTRKQRVFVDELLKDPTTNLTQAAKVAYPKASYETQQTIGHENMRKPKILQVLDSHSELAENTVVEVMKNSDNDNTRLNAANSLLDRVHGKATSYNVNENINYSIDDVVDMLV